MPALHSSNVEVMPLEKRCFMDLKAYLAENSDCMRYTCNFFRLLCILSLNMTNLILELATTVSFFSFVGNNFRSGNTILEHVIMLLHLFNITFNDF